MENTMSVSKRVVYTGLFLALGLLLPQMFHFLPIAGAGKVMLPMHIPAILAGYFLGSRSGATVGALSPILSCFIFQMPAVLNIPIMAVELAVYGIAAGFLGKKIKNTYLSLILVMICGRIASASMYVVMINIFGITKLNMQMFLATITTGLPGIVLQLLVIPPMIMLLRKVENGK